MMAEKKYWDQYQNDIGAGDFMTSGFHSLTNIPQGNDDTSRVGDKVTLNSIEYNLVITPNATASGYNNFSVYRLVIFKWYDDAAPTFGEIFQQDTPIESLIIGTLDHDHKPKRKILVDRTICGSFGLGLSQNGLFTDGYPVIFKGFVDLKKSSPRVRSVAYQGGTTTAVGHIYFGLCAGDRNTASNPDIWVKSVQNLSYYCRVNYIDV